MAGRRDRALDAPQQRMSKLRWRAGSLRSTQGAESGPLALHPSALMLLQKMSHLSRLQVSHMHATPMQLQGGQPAPNAAAGPHVSK
jgi:hypothetical protein